MPKQLDIGSGDFAAFQGHIREDMTEAEGLDIVQFEYGNKVADIAIEALPYKDDQFDLVTAHDVLEHIPKMLYMPTLVYEPGTTAAGKLKEMSLVLKYQRRNCMIELFNEVYRVLKDGGEFHFVVPKAGTTQYWADPTHCTEWVEDSINYYSGDYFGFHDSYGHKSKFKKMVVETDPERDWRMIVSLRAIKPMEPPYEV